MVWLVGSDGLLGHCVAEHLTACDVQWVGSTVDITQNEAVERFIANSGRKIKWIINCAAFTDVDAAEGDEDKAHQVNAAGCQNLGRAARYNGIRMIHISTNYVFDGTKDTPYTEDDEVHPINAYGRTKAAGEEYIAKEMTQYYILRTSCLYGRTAAGEAGGFVGKMLRLMNAGGDVRVVKDCLVCPTFTGDVADVVVKLLIKADGTPSLRGHSPKQSLLGKADGASSLRSHVPYGIYHYSSSPAVSASDVAHTILDLGLRYGKVTGQCHVVPCTTEEYAAGMTPPPAPRPVNGALDTSKIARALKLRVPHWQHSLETFIKG